MEVGGEAEIFGPGVLSTGAPELGSPVNTAFADFAPVLSWEGRTVLDRERPGIVPAISEGRPPGDLYSFDLGVGVSLSGELDAERFLDRTL